MVKSFNICVLCTRKYINLHECETFHIYYIIEYIHLYDKKAVTIAKSICNGFTRYMSQVHFLPSFRLIVTQTALKLAFASCLEGQARISWSGQTPRH